MNLSRVGGHLNHEYCSVSMCVYVATICLLHFKGYSMEKTNLIDVNLKPHHRPITTHVMHKTVEKKMRVSPHLTAFKVPQGGMSSVVFALIYHFGKMGNLGSKGQVLPQVTGRCGSKSEYSIWKKPHTSTERTFKHHTRFQKPGFEP